MSAAGGGGGVSSTSFATQYETLLNLDYEDIIANIRSLENYRLIDVHETLKIAYERYGHFTWDEILPDEIAYFIEIFETQSFIQYNRVTQICVSSIFLIHCVEDVTPILREVRDQEFEKLNETEKQDFEFLCDNIIKKTELLTTEKKASSTILLKFEIDCHSNFTVKEDNEIDDSKYNWVNGFITTTVPGAPYYLFTDVKNLYKMGAPVEKVREKLLQKLTIYEQTMSDKYRMFNEEKDQIAKQYQKLSLKLQEVRSKRAQSQEQESQIQEQYSQLSEQASSQLSQHELNLINAKDVINTTLEDYARDNSSQEIVMEMDILLSLLGKLIQENKYDDDLNLAISSVEGTFTPAPNSMAAANAFKELPVEGMKYGKEKSEGIVISPMDEETINLMESFSGFENNKINFHINGPGNSPSLIWLILCNIFLKKKDAVPPNFAGEALLLGILDNPTGLYEPTCFLAQMMRTQTNVTLTKLQTYLELIQGAQISSFISFEGCLHRYPSTPLAKYNEMLNYLANDKRGIVHENVKDVIRQQLELESSNGVASASGGGGGFNSVFVGNPSAGGGGSSADFDNDINQLAYQIQKNYSELATFNQLTTRVALPIPTHNAVLQMFGYNQHMTHDQKQEIIKNMYSMLQEMEYIAESKKEFYQMFGGKSKTKRKRSNKTKRRRPQKKSTRKKRR